MLFPTRISIILVFVISLCGIAVAQDGLIPVTTSSAEAREAFVKGRGLTDDFLFDEAQTYFARAVTLDPDFALAWGALAETRFSTKEYLEDMAKAVSLAGKVSECERVWILASDAGGKQDLARQRDYLGQLTAKCSRDPRAHFALGTYYFARQHWDSAAVSMTLATDLDPNFVPAWNMLGYVLRNLDDYSAAEQAFVKYIELKPDDANPYDSYAELLLKLGRYEESAKQYRKALGVDSTFATSRYGLASALVYLGRYDEARRELEKSARLAASDADAQTAHFGMAMVALDEGNYDNAVAEIELAGQFPAKINDVAQMAQTAATIGFLRLEQGRLDEALAGYQRSLEIMRGSDLPSTMKDFSERNMLYAQSRIAIKRDDLTTAKEFAARFAEASMKVGTVDAARAVHELNGIIALHEKKYDKAVEELMQANLKNGHNLFRLSKAYDGLGQSEKALENVAAAARMNSVLNINDLVKRKEALRLAAAGFGK